ncbi:GNAT family N-acetyltransferase [Kocuria sp. JC486]|uniref:GNAT family N-acetyltransferase n=1 Tax=Kocuria sp. JC486 TaxID=1970736 RepID=UPI0014247468|nr:GNAT family N-acetyltransferase [Kocuria sp. JC486]NHU84310.1 GNAT family N-acetyltransferase [Kocuria sp. JC486]
MAASSVDLPAPTAASAPDVRGIHQLRRQLEDWLSSRGINQWSAGQLSENSIRNQVASDLWRVAKTDDGEIIGAFRIQDQDPSFWPENPADSVFLHALMVDRSWAGCGLGTHLVEFASHEAREAGAQWLRLDCAAENKQLRSYYRRLGFQKVRDQDVDGLFTVTLMRKAL